MSRMKQLQALAKEAREKGDRDKYEMIRGDIFKEFDFDIGKFGGGGEIKYDKGSQMDKQLKGLDKARAKAKSDAATIRAGKKNIQNTIDKGMADLNKKYADLYKKAPLPPKIKMAKRIGNVAIGLGTAAFAGAGYEIKKMFDRNMQLGARSKYGSSQDYPERPDTNKFGKKIKKKNMGGEIRGKGKAIRGFKFGGIK